MLGSLLSLSEALFFCVEMKSIFLAQKSLPVGPSDEFQEGE